MELLAVIVLALVGAEDRTTALQTGRILGGERAPVGLYPYQVSLQLHIPALLTTIRRQRRWVHLCGGAIVSRRHIVTAAHCLDHRPVDLSILAGTTQLDGDYGQRVMVDEFVIHPHYVLLNGSDIAVVKGTRPFRYRADGIAPIHYTDELIGGGVKCVLAGWGHTSNRMEGHVPNELQRIVLTTITNDQCEALEPDFVDETGMCTEAPRGQGGCGGDAGSPLARGKLLVGIASYGSGVCGIGLPDVYTRVSVFAHWIKENTQ